jgi:hypothetical protein
MTCVLVKEADRWLITAAHNISFLFHFLWGEAADQ